MAATYFIHGSVLEKVLGGFFFKKREVFFSYGKHFPHFFRSYASFLRLVARLSRVCRASSRVVARRASVTCPPHGYTL